MPCPVSDSHHVGCRPSIAVVGSRAQTAVVAAPVGRLLSVVFECADPDEEGRFWEAMLGYARHHSGPDWVTIVDVVEQTQRLSFQRVEDHVQPTWPARDRPQQAHIDLLVEDLDNADGRAIALGARRLTDDAVLHEDESFRVYADPAGHPFCLIVQVTPDLGQEEASAPLEAGLRSRGGERRAGRAQSIPWGNEGQVGRSAAP